MIFRLLRCQNVLTANAVKASRTELQHINIAFFVKCFHIGSAQHGRWQACKMTTWVCITVHGNCKHKERDGGRQTQYHGWTRSTFVHRNILAVCRCMQIMWLQVEQQVIEGLSSMNQRAMQRKNMNWRRSVFTADASTKPKLKQSLTEIAETSSPVVSKQCRFATSCRWSAQTMQPTELFAQRISHRSQLLRPSEHDLRMWRGCHQHQLPLQHSRWRHCVRPELTLYLQKTNSHVS